MNTPIAMVDARLLHACRLIEQSPDRSLVELAAGARLSRAHFHLLFRTVIGVTPVQYARACKDDRVRSELSKGSPVLDAIFQAGFGSSSRVYEVSDQIMGMPPAQYRAGAPGMAISFAVGQSTLGSILGARTTKGVCAILLGDDPQVLVQQLQDRFPRAHLNGNDRGFDRWFSQIVGLVEAPGTELSLPLDIGGTVFQRKVWQALSAVPPGQTCTYADLARAIGAPASSRAVAQALAANPVAIAIPCHRVIRTDGALSGYRWGGGAQTRPLAARGCYRGRRRGAWAGSGNTQR